MIRKFVLILVFLIPLGLFGCIYDGPSSDARETFVSEERNIENFIALDLEGNYVVILENADSCSLEILGNEKMKNMVVTEVVDQVLKIRTIDHEKWKHYPEVEIHIKVPSLEKINVRAAASFKGEKPFVFKNLFIESSGALKMDMEVQGDKLEGRFAGATKLNLKGEVKEVLLDIPGAGKISAYELLVEDFGLKMAGAGMAEVFASDKLSVDVAGACNVTYKGNPMEVYTNISGLGRVKKAQ
ncbi:head GIN domain-containing protein [Thermophagus sp. OGC60D27]|uniref:head GIN domain-containing protein n=1 Tax=Thermophagus sp. OGC60D27 TaxID=3458415 RepID=UPI0040383DAE